MEFKKPAFYNPIREQDNSLVHVRQMNIIPIHDMKCLFDIERIGFGKNVLNIIERILA
jgi:hypothetical protein